MSPLEAMKRVEERSRVRDSCWFCGAYHHRDRHGHRCPVPLLPQIVQIVAEVEDEERAAADEEAKG